MLDWLFKPNIEKMKAKRDFPGLIKALDYFQDDQIRKAAAEALGDLGDPCAVEPLVAWMNGGNGILHVRAGDALVKIGAPSVKPLIGVLKEYRSFSESIYMDTVNVLVRIGEPSIQPLISALKKNNSNMATYAAKALVKIGRPSVKPLIGALKDSNENIRNGAAETLGNLGDQSAVDPLIAALNDSDSSVRYQAVAALGKLRAPRSFGPLVAALKDQSSGVRQAAAEVLGPFGNRLAVEPLIAVLKDEEWPVRREAEKALGALGWKAPKDPEVTDLPDESATIRNFAHFIIEMGSLRAVVERERLETAIKGELAFAFDLTDDTARELLDTGRTTVKTIIGTQAEVTLTGCNCSNMLSHQRADAAHFQA